MRLPVLNFFFIFDAEMFLICSYFPNWTLPCHKEECQTEYHKNTPYFISFILFLSNSAHRQPLETTISPVSIKKTLYQCHSSYTKRASSHWVLYLTFLSTYNICINYLHVIEACLKVIIAMFYICHSENPSNIMKIIFNSISIYSWKKISLLSNIRNKHVTRKINLYFFDVMKKAIFFLQKFVIFNMITDSFLGEKWGTLERTRGYV